MLQKTSKMENTVINANKKKGEQNMKSYELEKTEWFIDHCITSMEQTIEFTKSSDDMSRKDKVGYARWSIDNSDREGHAVLRFAKIYLEVITEEEYKALGKKLHDAWEENLDRILEEIK